MRRLAFIASLAVVTATGCGSSSSESEPPVTTAATTQAQACTEVSQPSPRDAETLEPPRAPLDTTKQWRLTFRTSCGTFVVVLQPQTSPKATASLVSLARRGFFDDTIFHRIVPGFVVQGGDPTQSGSGGPGYTTVDTPKAGTRYVTGTVAMAKTGAEPRGAAGSQFFVMTADAPGLDPDYAVVGRVVSGMPAVQRIGKLGDPADPAGAPTQTVGVDRVTVASR